ncbi:MAG: hypothetical protein LBP33_09940 [Candidatus Adiutrix sp.]|jgi:hypothetical protein|nr:hypothetical protein [Candidatus Adiutrix sp.]
MKFLFWAALILAAGSAAGLDPGRPASARAEEPRSSVWPRPYDRGNCFHWPGCRGDSLGNTLIDSPARCATLGGRSWLGGDGRCYSFPGGPQAYFPENYELRGPAPGLGRSR